MDKISVLIIEDDEDLARLLGQYLLLQQFEVARVINGSEARAILCKQRFDILLIDVMMPVEDGFTLAAAIRLQYPALPFLFLTARKQKEDVLKGLGLGADDYIIKPFDADELILRIRNILKRSQSPMPSTIAIGSYGFEPAQLRLTHNGKVEMLTEKESLLLEYLCRTPNQLQSRKVILELLWGDADFFNGRSLDVFITRLRKLLSADPTITITTVRGVGFVLKVGKG